MGGGIKSDGRRQYALFTVNHKTQALEDTSILHAVRTTTISKEKPGAVAIAYGQGRTNNAVTLAAPDTISVADALAEVNTELKFDDVLPLDVMNHFGQNRRVNSWNQKPNGYFVYSLSSRKMEGEETKKVSAMGLEARQRRRSGESASLSDGIVADYNTKKQCTIWSKYKLQSEQRGLHGRR